MTQSAHVMQHVRRMQVAVVLIGLMTAGGIATTASASPRPSHSTITGGSSKIKLSNSTLKAMKANHFTLSAISPATFNGKTLTSPIKGGTFTIVPEAANINAGGGFKIAHDGTSVSVTKIKSRTNGTSGSGTGIVSGKGRIKVIVTGQPKSLSPTGSTVTASGFSVTLAKPLIKTLDGAFGTTLFKKHAKVGKGSASFNYS